MKTFTSFFAIALVFASLASAIESQKPLVSIRVKRQLLDSEHDMLGRQGSSKQKTFTLRVEITNASATPVAQSELSGEALVTRAAGERERIVKESLGQIKVPEMKPNATLSLDLGKITLKEFEWQNRKFEETLNEWKVVCTKGAAEIGMAESSARFETLAKEVTPAAVKREAPVGPFRGNLRRLPK